MRRKIIAASLAVILTTGLFACGKAPDNRATESDAPATPANAVTARVAETEIPSTTEGETTTSAPTATEEPTTVATTVKQILTTVKKVTTTGKPTTTKKPAPKTTKAEPETTEKMLYDEYRTEEKVYDVNLKYGIVLREIVNVHYVKLPDGSEAIEKEEILTEYYDRTFYSASYDDLLPAAKENRENYRQKINEVLRIINGYRAAGGLEPLKLNEDLTIIANVRAEEIAWSGNHNHTRPNLQSCFSLMRENGFDTGIAGENIGWGYDSATSVCEAWKNSETHYENIMNPKFTEVGIGVAADPKPSGKLCWSKYFYG